MGRDVVAQPGKQEDPAHFGNTLLQKEGAATGQKLRAPSSEVSEINEFAKLKKCSDELVGSRRWIDEQSACAGDRSGTVVLYLRLNLVVRVNIYVGQ